ncbi:MAG: hypothetical protein P8H36_11620 [Yoonia sp.]|nr:hypothetical protein [Yoonia sp.]
MSDPVINVEIEDVLSSIRRLVAEGDKSAPNPAEHSDPAASRFVLTPALRVADPVAPEGDAEDDVALSPEAEELAAQCVAPAPAPLVLQPAEIADEPLVHDDMSDADRASLEETIAELEAAVTDQDEEWEPDGSETALTAASATLTAIFEGAVDHTGDLVKHDDIEAVEDDEDDIVLQAEPEAEVVPLHTADTAFRHATPDDADADFGDELAADDDDGVPIPDDLDENIAAYLAGGGTSAIDQDILREMIAEVVREELQGKMGERITRNIRKLVRREINNALSSRSV